MTMTLRPALRRPLLAAALLLAFVYPALLNRAPILYPDSIGYLQSGRAALAALGLDPATEPAPSTNAPRLAPGPAAIINTSDGVTTARSVFYGAIAAASYALLGPWALPLFQIAVIIAALWLALRRLVGRHDDSVAAAVALTGAVAGAGAFAGTVMPDVFAGLLILAIAMSVIWFGAMHTAERLFWLALALAAILFHKSHLALAAPLLAFAAALTWRTARPAWSGLAALGGVLVIGVASHALVDVTTRARLGVAPITPPFLLARLVGDGTAVRFLRAECATRQYEVCRYLAHMPMTENEFLWSKDPERGAFALLDAAGKRRLAAQERAIVGATLRRFGAEQAFLSAGNAARQAALVGVQEYGLGPRIPPEHLPWIAPLLRSYQSTAIAKRTMPLRTLSIAMTLSYLLAAATLCWLLLRRAPPGADPPRATEVVLIVVAGVLANAVICGAISGVFDRYQGRVAWVLTAVALGWLLGLRQRAVSPPNPLPSSGQD